MSRRVEGPVEGRHKPSEAERDAPLEVSRTLPDASVEGAPQPLFHTEDAALAGQLLAAGCRLVEQTSHGEYLFADVLYTATMAFYLRLNEAEQAYVRAHDFTMTPSVPTSDAQPRAPRFISFGSERTLHGDEDALSLDGADDTPQEYFRERRQSEADRYAGEPGYHPPTTRPSEDVPEGFWLPVGRSEGMMSLDSAQGVSVEAAADASTRFKYDCEVGLRLEGAAQRTPRTEPENFIPRDTALLTDEGVQTEQETEQEVDETGHGDDFMWTDADQNDASARLTWDEQEEMDDRRAWWRSGDHYVRAVLHHMVEFADDPGTGPEWRQSRQPFWARQRARDRWLYGRATEDQQRPRLATRRAAVLAAVREAEAADAHKDSTLWVPTKRAAEILGVMPAAVRKWRERHGVPTQRVERSNAYRLDDVWAYWLQVAGARAEAASARAA